MPDAILSRGSTSVSIPLMGEAGDLAVARDVGKPTMKVQDVGRENPLTQDFLNASDAITLAGIMAGPDAYTDARTLAEDLIKPRATTGSPLQLDLSALPERGTYDVAPASARACTLNYVPGQMDMVGVQLTLTLVASAIGGDQAVGAASTPDSGSGIKLDRSGTGVTFTGDQTVTRKVGRPGGKLNERPDDLPTYIDPNAPAQDVFEIQTSLRGDSAEADAQALEEDLIRTRLGSDSLTLHFLGGLYDLGAYEVVPEGTQAVRTAMSAGETGIVSVPKLALRVVDNS